jgi:riboflavin kinase/FMN adenylyltransferase
MGPAAWNAAGMRVWHDLSEVDPDLGPTVVTIGNFDGVHRGHQAVLRHARAQAERLGGLPVVALTFHPHTMVVVRPDRAPAALTGPDERADLLGAAGADAVLVLPFTREVASWPPEEFIDRVLENALHTDVVVVGETFRFGNRAAGTVQTLIEAGLTVEALPLEGDGGPEHQPWSSTYVRERVAEGDVEAAAEALGRPMRVTGVVVEGDHRGHELGFPTANVPAEPAAAVPADGVYAGWLTVLDQVPGGPAYPEPLPAAVSVGTNPTFDGLDRRVESHVLDRDDLELYGARVAVDFVSRLRGQVRYDSIDDLVSQVKADIDACRQILTGS